MFVREAMLYKIVAFWIVVVGLVAGRVALHDRIAIGGGWPQNQEPNAMSTTMRN